MILLYFHLLKPSGSFLYKSLKSIEIILSFFYDPLPRVLPASPPAASSAGVIRRFKTKIIQAAPVRNTPRPLYYLMCR